MSDPINFAKMAADLDSNPKIRRAGRNGRDVYLFVLRRVALLKRQGSIPVSNVDPGYLAHELQMPESDALDGVKACLKRHENPITGEVEEPLLSIHDGEVHVEGWTDEWGRRPMTPVERQQKKRDKDKHKEPEATAAPEHERHAPSRSVTENHASHGSDQIRSEEIRSERSETLSPPARVIPLHGPGSPQQAQAFSQLELAMKTWRDVDAARMRVAAELSLPNVIAMPSNIGTPAEPRGFRDLRDRIREEGSAAPTVCEQVVKNLAAEASETTSVEWLSEKAFTEGGWQHARNWHPGRKSRAGPRGGRVREFGSAPPNHDHPSDGYLTFGEALDRDR